MKTITLLEEYARLQEFLQNKENFVKVEYEYLTFLGFGPPDGHGLRYPTAFKASSVQGISISLKTMEFCVSEEGKNHERATEALVEKIGDTSLLSYPPPPHLVRGHIVPMSDWAHPFVSLQILPDRELLKRLEEFILEKEIGLPVTSLIEKLAR